jgi:hypothetical protein
MKPIHDQFIGLVAIAIGCWLIAGAVFQWPMIMQLTKSRLLAESAGATATRWIITAFGVATIALGALIASGWRVQW